MVKKAESRKSPLRFVVHEHHASHLHYDFRLEMGGVLRSWAIPKGPSMNPKDKRLAIMVEDHPLEYAKFEGIITEGYYGAGAVIIWDQGQYVPLKAEQPERQIEKGRMGFILKGKKLKGSFALSLLKSKGRNQWLLIKKQDNMAETNWKIKPVLTDEKRKSLKYKVPSCEAS
ncbi:MAG TPA: 3'-phosphoesterase [Syntrophaceae bacterium]|nr:3'-phosphoesterase [Syntrophaceae bacterium]